MPLTFTSGSGNGTEVCASVIANVDEEVECEEDFMVLLSLMTPGNNLNLANTATAITIIDSNGMNLHDIDCARRVINAFFFSCIL